MTIKYLCSAFKFNPCILRSLRRGAERQPNVYLCVRVYVCFKGGVDGKVVGGFCVRTGDTSRERTDSRDVPEPNLLEQRV